MKILIGATGCIAIYKVVGLVSSLRKAGHELKIIMTESAQKLVSKTLFSAVGNCEVYTDEDSFDVRNGWIPHTELSKWPDILVVAPATANTIAKLANGFADNLLTMVCLAYEKDRKLLIPAMNYRMYENQVTQYNLQAMKQRGWWVLEPSVGHLACGESGRGRYPENEIVQEAIYVLASEKPLKGMNLLITAGPTWESIDPVRVLSNRSSGKMGYELAKVAVRLGANVTLVSGPTSLVAPYFVEDFVKVESADQMYREVEKRFNRSDGVIMAAAVADYSPTKKSDIKIKKGADKLNISFKKTVDILGELGRKKGEKILVGFAVESQSLEDYAIEKLKRKNLDMIVANQVDAMGSDKNTVLIIKKDGTLKRVGPDEKERIALAVLTELADFWSRSRGNS
ncbi:MULTISPECIES: bifunctional phosphopantothenoylcysteine decarboxylase/phosphopantothenate--cysteine ligase CoaBC [Pseudothermotoga]|jgi:phosphopantothenoylcysteine decarboxylase/phosphopantothenate--cysteine ligase|uniref:Coenzyme A biosynthesis bifunctional protein CoaBC n=1 Tax=Pseudothermotoga lettingae (strain ATCC BAA-301 / DSM 14385 / NBRC 107922 / TMO) TaxID=416591 RepID=A8F7P6_PSELT|nr:MULTISPECIES: bifunctional phosphopantothenoylcysteine decarboxylase/phosphopantothenate--cysteine ligase CoaBC [Pseudothermotoga]ABV34180.1 phosphopantothenoylcysteine decarboxylase/phosphopantothenate--cysteine ligase [Pseudothermotoga lettingae TMO]MDK2884786.1 phosphopantothenoylcysteine decarboxylase / phosphopantothenate---cysteine ligase [Pseudothermotoga sp.]GLI48876.1 DNA/pantothenate metabolism flavoprotein [Pseudothermotoga lettingae TMO]HBJ81192.1 bifunctional phosphopantothenoyl